MRVRALDSLHDWTFGKGQNNYKTRKDAVAQNIDTRLQSFLGDCFFDMAAGIDWFRFLGSKDPTALNLAIAAVILNTPYVLSIQQLSIGLTTTRQFSVSYRVTTSFGVIVQPTILTNYLLTQDGQIITTEDGERIGV